MVRSSSVWVAWLMVLSLLGCQRMNGAPSPEVQQRVPHKTDLPLVVENHALGSFAVKALESVRVSTRLLLEQRGADGEWVVVTSPGVRFLTECATPDALGACRALAAGETVVTVPWNGDDCAPCAQPCAGETFHPGIYRAVIAECDDPSVRVNGPEFELPPERRMLQRWRAVAGAASGRAVRVDPRVVGASPGSIDYVPREGSERTLSSDLLAEFVRLVRSDKFVDGFLPSCRPGPILAFIVDAPSGRETQLVVDLGCGALLVPAVGAKPRERSFFPTLYLDFLDLAARALPDDAELGRFIQQERRARQSRGTTHQ